jgi:hypothetical protein
MTIAICIRVDDGVVLASDSASTIHGETGVYNVYNYANKIFNLYKGLPVGAVTWGLGNIGRSSIYTLIKDLRNRLMGEDMDWMIDRENYTIEDFVDKTLEFIYVERYQPLYSNLDDEDKPYLGFFIAGYSANRDYPEIWKAEIRSGHIIKEEIDALMVWNGEYEIISRIVKGYSPMISEVLLELGIPEDALEDVLKYLEENLEVFLVHPAMPIQDAIDLADFLVDTAIKFARFRPGAPSIGGPIEIAAISKHEGFKWVKRKHYYSRELNPEG